MADKEPGWERFLQERGVWDSKREQDDLYLRFLKLRDKTFPAAPAACWPQLFQCLANLEDCFVVGEAMGVVHDHPFVFTVQDPTPFVQRPLPAPPQAAEWLRQKFERDCEIGRLRRMRRGCEPDPTFVSNVVLVPKKGAWRECANLVQANGRIKPAVHPVPDCMAVLT